MVNSESPSIQSPASRKMTVLVMEWFNSLILLVIGLRSACSRHKLTKRLITPWLTSAKFHPVFCLLSPFMCKSVVCKQEIFMKLTLGKNHFVVTSNDLVV